VRLPGGEGAYVLPELPTQQIAPEDHLRRVLGEWAVELAQSGNLVVLRTPPGCAHVVGSALDRSGLEGLLGTVAGDDTVLAVVSESHGGAAMAARLASLSASIQRDRRPTDDQWRASANEGRMKMAKRIVLAYSGGLDTSVRCVADPRARSRSDRRRRRRRPVRRVERRDWEAIRQRALVAGAIEATVIDARAEMAGDFCLPAIAANARTRASTPSSPALSRPVIVRHLVAEARRHGATAVAHGCTGRATTRSASKWALARSLPTSR